MYQFTPELELFFEEMDTQTLISKAGWVLNELVAEKRIVVDMSVNQAENPIFILTETIRRLREFDAIIESRDRKE